MNASQDHPAPHRIPARAKSRDCGRSAFTRTELAATLAVLALLAAVVLPALANTRPRAQRLTCVSNLREIGQSFTSWSSDYGNRLPSQVSGSEGGTLNHFSGLQNSAWFQFAVISNHVRTPRVFVCPADAVKVEASNWDATASFGGFMHANYRNNALSYIISHPFIEARPDVLAGDRNLTGGVAIGNCAYWSPSLSIQRYPANYASWTDAIHPASGNVVLSDGRVEQLSSTGLRQRLAEAGSDANNVFHYLTP